MTQEPTLLGCFLIFAAQIATDEFDQDHEDFTLKKLEDLAYLVSKCSRKERASLQREIETLIQQTPLNDRIVKYLRDFGISVGAETTSED